MSHEYKLGDYTIKLSGWGKNKKEKDGSYLYGTKDTRYKTKEEIDIKLLDTFGKTKPDIWMFGQDGFGVYKHKSSNSLIMVNTDGHGGIAPELKEGIDFSYYSLIFSIIEISKNINSIKNIVKANNKDTLNMFMNDIFQKVDNDLIYNFPITKNYRCGGSTLTVNIKFVYRNKLYSVTTNTGDSVLMHIDTSKNLVVEDTLSLNCDRLESYNIYVSKCNSRNIKPKNIYLGRFNFMKKNVYWVEPYNRPIYPFKLILDRNEYRAEHNTEAMKEFYNNAPFSFRESCLKMGGSQSIRDRKYNIEQMKLGKYPSTNFGNTAEGRCQCLPGCSIGDRLDKNEYKDIMITNTSITTFKSPNKKYNMEIIGSDGFFDTITDDMILKNLKLYNTNILDKIEGLKNTMFNQTNINHWGTKWDDITFCLVEITKKNKSINKLKLKRNSRKKRRKLNKFK